MLKDNDAFPTFLNYGCPLMAVTLIIRIDVQGKFLSGTGWLMIIMIKKLKQTIKRLIN